MNKVNVHLNCPAAPVEAGVDGVDKDRPAILEIGYHGHADHSHDKLHPRMGTKARKKLERYFASVLLVS